MSAVLDDNWDIPADRESSGSTDREFPDDTPENREKALDLLRKANGNNIMKAMEVFRDAESYEEIIEGLRALVGYTTG
jgi:hypothetical protein